MDISPRNQWASRVQTRQPGIARTNKLLPSCSQTTVRVKEPHAHKTKWSIGPLRGQQMSISIQHCRAPTHCRRRPRIVCPKNRNVTQPQKWHCFLEAPSPTLSFQPGHMPGFGFRPGPPGPQRPATKASCGRSEFTAHSTGWGLGMGKLCCGWLAWSTPCGKWA